VLAKTTVFYGSIPTIEAEALPLHHAISWILGMIEV